MDVAYDHIQEEALSPEEPETPPKDPEHSDQPRPRTLSNDLNSEFREAYQALSSSAWGIKLGGFWGAVRKQGESYFETAKQELSAASTNASRGVNGLVSETGSLSVDTTAKPAEKTPEATSSVPSEESTAGAIAAQQPESLPADIVKEAQSMFSRIQVSASDRLKTLQKAEDAADEALLKFGTNIRDFFRDAIVVTGPDDDGKHSNSEVLFESKAADGRRVVHATRFDAQLHVIHTTPSSFTQDPVSEEYPKWKEQFDAEKETARIAKDLNQHEALRKAMEDLVPESVEYKDFWCRYYFLRHVIETEEAKRRSLLGKAAKGGLEDDEEEVGWGDEEEDEGHVRAKQTPTPTAKTSDQANLKPPHEGRRSNENSVADSDTSYSVISRVTSGGPSSPKEQPKGKSQYEKADDSDEDWE